MMFRMGSRLVVAAYLVKSLKLVLIFKQNFGLSISLISPNYQNVVQVTTRLSLQGHLHISEASKYSINVEGKRCYFDGGFEIGLMVVPH